MINFFELYIRLYLNVVFYVKKDLIGHKVT